MTDDRALEDQIGRVLERDRDATDESLRTERDRTDTVIGASLAQETDERLERTRERTERRLDERAGNASVSSDLPEAAETLAEAAETLATAADGLSRAAHELSGGRDAQSTTATLHEVAEALDKTADNIIGEDLGQAGQMPPPAAPEEAQPVVTSKLADVAESLGVVATTLAEERRQTDDAMREERELVDESLKDEREDVDAALDDERDGWRQLLPTERCATDRDLERERADTDRAVQQTIDLLEDEAAAHRRTRDVVVTRDEFLAIVSHDLRTPLNTIALSASLLAEQLPRDERGHHALTWIDDIRRASNLMGRMLSDLLDATRFEEGRFRVSLVKQDIVDVVAECAAAFDAFARVNGLSIHLVLPAAPLTATFDRDRILQVLSNLIRNAVQFTPAGGTIIIQVSGNSEESRIAVSDTGAGIPSGDLERIFERFHQGQKTDRAGLGLGLYISKAIVEAHGGRIWVDSDVGRGSTSIFTIPA